VRRYALVSTLCLLLLTACGGEESGGRSTPAAPLPAGFKRIGGLANGVLIAVPESWTAMDLTKDDVTKSLEEAGLSGATLEQAKTAAQALVANKAVYAVDPQSLRESETRFATNLNGFCQPSVGASAQALIDVAKSQLATVNAKVSEAAEIPLGAARGVRIKYTLPFGKVTVKGAQYYVPSGKGKTCVVTLSTDLDGKDALFDQIGGTIRAI
jgi:hypothetical protein